MEGCIPGSIHFIIVHEDKKGNSRNELIEQIVHKVKHIGKQASCLKFNVADPEACENFAKDFFTNEFSPLKTKLRFGHMYGSLCIHPRPPGISSDSNLQVLGIVKVAELDGPPLESRHIIQVLVQKISSKLC